MVISNRKNDTVIRLSAIFLILLLILSCTPTVCAESAPAILLDTQYDFFTGQIRVSVIMQDNPGIFCFRALLEFDQSGLSLTSVTDKGLLSGFTSSLSEKDFNSPYTLMWYDFNYTSDNTKTGCIAELVFDVKDFSKGEFTFSLTPDQKNTKNAQGDRVTFPSAAEPIRVPQSTDLPTMIMAATYDNSGKMTACRQYDPDTFIIPMEGKTYLFLLDKNYAPVGDRFELIH